MNASQMKSARVKEVDEMNRGVGWKVSLKK